MNMNGSNHSATRSFTALLTLTGAITFFLSCILLTSTLGQNPPPEEPTVEESPAPVEETTAPIEDVNKPPTEETPIEETSIEKPPVEETPVEETPVEEQPVEEQPAPIDPKVMLQEGKLTLPNHKLDLGEPTGTDAELLEALARMHTNPGDLPHLQIQIDGQNYDLPLKHTHVKAELTGMIARVEITQSYHNPLSTPLETIYVFPLPENSAVDDMRIQIEDRIIEAEIHRRAEARAIYEEAREEGYTTALLEQERPNIFTQSIANIAPESDIDIVIRYVQNLNYDAGMVEFVFPMVVGPRFIPGPPVEGQTGHGWSPDTSIVPDASRITPPLVGGGMRTGHDISLELTATAGAPIEQWTVPTHDVTATHNDNGSLTLILNEAESLPNRDFALRFKTAEDKTSVRMLTHNDKQGGFFTLLLQPPVLDLDELVGQREFIFVVDVSGSMGGLPLSLCKRMLKLMMRRIRPVDTFNVITFAGSQQLLFDRPVPADDAMILKALQLIDGLTAGGGTMMGGAIEAALRPDVEPGRRRYVIFMTDGYVGNEDQILSATEDFVEKLEDKGQIARVFGIGVSSSPNRDLIEGLGEEGNGLSLYLLSREEPDQAVDRLFSVVDHQILTDIKLDWGTLPVEDLLPSPIPDLFASTPIFIHGRYSGTGAGTIKVSGTTDDGDIEYFIDVDFPEHQSSNGALTTLWARAKIDSLEREMLGSYNKDAEELITNLGMDFRIVTAYTSFVAVDRSRKVGEGDPPQVIVQPGDMPEGMTMIPGSMSYAVSLPNSPHPDYDTSPAVYMIVDSEPEEESESLLTFKLGNAILAIKVLASGMFEHGNDFPVDRYNHTVETEGILYTLFRLKASISSGKALHPIYLKAEYEQDFLKGPVLANEQDIKGVGLPYTEDVDMAQLRKAYMQASFGNWFTVGGGYTTSDWGLGFVANNGDHHWSSKSAQFTHSKGGDITNRILFATGPHTDQNILVSLFLDNPQDDDVLLSGDEAFQAGGAIMFGSKLNSLGLSGYKTGLYGIHRWINHPGNKTTQATVLDIFGGLLFSMGEKLHLSVEFEGVLIFGETDLAPSTDFPVHDLLNGGGVFRVSLDADFVGCVFDFVYASGDANNYDQSQNAFKSDPNFNMGFLLFDQVLASQTGVTPTTASDPDLVGIPSDDLDRIPTRGSITNTLSAYPRLWFKPLKMLEIYGGVLFALADRPYHDAANSRLEGDLRNSLNGPTGNYYGTEIDLGIRFWIPIYGVTLELGVEGGVFLPGNAFDTPTGSMESVYGLRGTLNIRL